MGKRKSIPSILILAELTVGNPTVSLLCDALRADWNVTLAAPDGEEGAASHRAAKGITIGRDPWVFRALRAVRRLFRKEPAGVAPPPGVILPFGLETLPSVQNWGRFEWLRYGLHFIFKTPAAVCRASMEPAPDLVLCVDGLFLPAARLLGRLWKRPHGYMMLEIYPDQEANVNARKRRLMAMVERFGLRSAAGALVQDTAWGRLLRIRYHMPELSYHVITTCPSLPPRQADPEPGMPLRLYYHGLYQQHRGLEDLILAMKETKGATLSLRGFGTAEQELRDLVRDHSLEGRVFFLPPVKREDLAAVAADFDVGVTPGSGEIGNGRFAVGFKTYEYMAAGLALLAPPSRALVPMLRRTGTGFIYLFGGPSQVAAAINRITPDRSLVAACKASSRRWSRELYNDQVQQDRLRSAVALMAGS
jgi:glycosyltransferase involved in cell wall biosynthesis